MGCTLKIYVSGCSVEDNHLHDASITPRYNYQTQLGISHRLFVTRLETMPLPFGHAPPGHAVHINETHFTIYRLCLDIFLDIGTSK